MTYRLTRSPIKNASDIPSSMARLFERYRKGTAESVLALGKVAESELPLEDKWIKEYSRPIPIWFQGV
jgi:hypothetical protein